MLYGDQVQIQIDGKLYIYEVRENKLISPKEVKIGLAHENSAWVTLLTCEDYNSSSKQYDYRRLVRALLIDVKENQK